MKNLFVFRYSIFDPPSWVLKKEKKRLYQGLRKAPFGRPGQVDFSARQVVFQLNHTEK